MTRSGASCSVRSGSGDEVSGGRSSAATELWPRARKREGKERGSDQELTARSERSSASSGASCVRRINGGGGRSPRGKTMVVSGLQRVRGLVAWWRGRGGRGGASGRKYEARQWLWPRRCSSAATDASDIAGEDEGGMQGERGEVQGGEKECVATSRASGH